jgi:PAS domain-containing protein
MISACPIRYTDKMPQMRAFLEALGFQPRIAADAGNWVDFNGGGQGLVALHEVPAGQAGTDELAFETDEPLETLCKRLQDAGYADARIIDESYGHSLQVTDPDGRVVYVNARSDDMYGYHRVPPAGHE